LNKYQVAASIHSVGISRVAYPMACTHRWWQYTLW